MRPQPVGSMMATTFAALAILLACLPGGGRAETVREENSRQDLDEVFRKVEGNAQAIQKLRNRTQEARKRPPAASTDFGIAASENFTVFAPAGDFLARDVLNRAEELRQEIALAWLGHELPPGDEFTNVTVKLSNEADEALTLLCGPGRQFQGNHRMWLTTTRELALGNTLAHEVAHVVLNARFPHGMPAWANEGIASLYDDAGPQQRRRRILEEFVETNQWPSLAGLLRRDSISPSDQTAYALSVSLTEFFLERGDRDLFLQFIEDGSRNGWDAAVDRHYGIAGIDEIQRLWQSWVSRSFGHE